MSVTLQDLIDGAQDACDKRDDPSVSTDLWRRFINAAIKALYKKLVSQHADTWITSVDFTIASAAANVYSFDETFDQLRHVTRDPTTQNRRPVRPFNMQEVDDFRGEPRYRIMGRKLYFEPPESAPGNYRAWYVPRPQEFLTVVEVRLFSTDDLPPPGDWSPSLLNEYVGFTNGALSVDGVAVEVDDLICISNEPFPENNGLYRVTATGGASAAPALLREIGYREGQTMRTPLYVRATEGDVNIDITFALDADAVIGTDSDPSAEPITFTSSDAFDLDIVFEPYREYIEVYAAAMALEKEQSDSSQQRARCKEIEMDIEALAGAQEAGAQVAIADVEDDPDPRRRRHPYPFT